MSKAHPPELKKCVRRGRGLKLNGGRHVQGILRGFDPFMNLVIDECVEMAAGGQQNNIGMVPGSFLGTNPSFLLIINEFKSQETSSGWRHSLNSPLVTNPELFPLFWGCFWGCFGVFWFFF
uniref:Small nuclear ribonucleoprotein G n=1 Tax=Junco hyemalis TaxID=40217 RepID=A0A8C5IEH4_JUNHY